MEDGRLHVTHRLDKVRECRAVRREVMVRSGLEDARVHFGTPVNRTGAGRNITLRADAKLPDGLARPERMDGKVWYRCHPLWLTPYRYPSVAIPLSAAAPPDGG